MNPKLMTLAVSTLLSASIAALAQERNLYWGDTHLHVRNSIMDAYFTY